ncbi:outer membrane porin protein [Janthinobacterium sp. HH01]|uniref:porin n=1 Tax=Janthinobacterium sp. HH01 TaxID=1198452 RepID=UPI0002AEADF6|nr:porin [Janthinobacterium sp. HH01]ELX08931.1 outer membrane porin protein [Janthinobacterium sp. HH01]
MKKSIYAVGALALATCSAAALAQSNVTFYGVMDMGISQDRGGIAGTSTRATSGMATQSRWGFRGNEDLGGGMSAFFVIEGGIHADTGTSTQNNTLFGRTSIVGLGTKYGAVSAGLQDTPLFTTLNTVVDPLRNGIARSNNLMSSTGFRAGNSVLYRTPVIDGFSADAMYVAGEVAGDQRASRALGGSFGYSRGPLNVRLAYHNKNNDTATLKNTGSARNTLLGANYDFGPAKAWFGYGVDRGLNSSPLNSSIINFEGPAPVASTDSRDVLLGVTVPCGLSTVVATYINKNDRTARNQDAQQYALAYMYAFSKRTDIYTSYALIRNHNGGGYTEGNSEEPGIGNRQFTVGLRHRF